MTTSPRCLFASSFAQFYSTDSNAVFGVLCEKYHGEALATTRDAWIAEIAIMKRVPSPYAYSDGQIVFECLSSLLSHRACIH